jgi:hypothetical protein
MEVCDQFDDLATLPHRKNPQYPLDIRMGRPQSWPDTVVKKKSPSPSSNSQFLGHRAHSLITILTQLSPNAHNHDELLTDMESITNVLQ